MCDRETRTETRPKDATAPLNITVTATAQETLVWRSLARQAVPMLERPEQFPIRQRSNLAQTICRLLSGDLELEDVFCDRDEDAGAIADAEYEPGCGDGEDDPWTEEV